VKKEVVVREFDRLENSTIGPGRSVEYTSPYGETLAYVDYDETRATAQVTVFDNSEWRSGKKDYASRPAANAEAIAHRHVARMGYSLPTE
jgi:hypothetical protein